MSNKPDDDSSLADKADAAFRQAAVKVIQKAKDTGTSIVVWEEGRVKEIPPDEFEARMNNGDSGQRDPSTD